MATSGIQLRCGPEHVLAMDVTLTATVAAGDTAKVHDTVGVYMEAGDADDVVAFVYCAPKIVLAKDVVSTSVVFEIGDKVYWNDYDNNVTNNSSGNTLVGIALEKALYGATTLLVDFDGRPRS